MLHQDMQTSRCGLKKRGTVEFFFNRLQGVSIPNETFFRTFDIASQIIKNLWEIQRKSSPNLMVISITYPNSFTVVISVVFSS